jgi:phosphatidate cytidylyltransferase
MYLYRAVEGSRTYSNQTSETETETETESEMFEEASAKRPAGADGKSGSGGDTGTGVNEKGPPPWKQLGIKIANAPKIDETENFANLQTTSKWFPNAYKAPEQPEETEQEMAVRKRQEFWTRTRWTFAMFLSFMFVIASGALYVAALIVCIKVGMFYEILGLKRNKEKDKRIPWFRTLNWYFFATTIYYVYGRILQYHIQVVHFERAYIGWLTDHHTFKSFALWCSGFVMFVLSLEKSTFKYQFTQFGWTHITLLMVVVSASCMIKNMFEGMVWFFIPVCLVIWNDVYAYVFGRFWGKTPLIKLSPKKTWEGFLGMNALVLTYADIC